MTQNKLKATYLTLNETYTISQKLAKNILHSGYSPDVIVAVARGGFPPARFLCDFLNIKNLQSIQVTHYTSGAEKMEKAQVLNKSLNNLENKNVLLVDDVNDSGETLSAAIQHLSHAKQVKTAVLHEKENSGFNTSFFGEKLYKWKWLIYPWAAKEDILEFLEKDEMMDAPFEQVRKFLKTRYDLEIESDILSQLMYFRESSNKNI